MPERRADDDHRVRVVAGDGLDRRVALLGALGGTLLGAGLPFEVRGGRSRDDDRVAKRRDRKVDRDGDVEMDEYNQMLAKLADRDGR